jgi:ribokinase
MKTKSNMRARIGRVIVVGSSNTDLVVQCENLPRAGETVLGADMATFAGGKGANQAVAAARAGARVKFIGAFGDDAFGKARRADLERDGIDCSGCVVKKGVPSGVALIGIGRSAENSAAENQIIVAGGANARLTPADVRRGLPADLSHRDVVLCSLEVPVEAVREAFVIARRKGAATVLNPAPYPPKGLPRSILDLCSAITPNETEFQALANGSSKNSTMQQCMLNIFKRTHCSALIVTQGSKGVHYFFPHNDSLLKNRAKPAAAVTSGAMKWELQVVALGPTSLGVVQVTPPKVKPVDTVGAGDCLNGAFAAHLAANYSDFEKALRFAVAAAAVKVTRHGAQAGMPRRNDILKMLKKVK